MVLERHQLPKLEIKEKVSFVSYRRKDTNILKAEDKRYEPECQMCYWKEGQYSSRA